MTFVSVYTTWPNTSEAETAAEVVVTEKLAACANIIANVKSIYVWDEELQKDSEIIMILKTKKSLFKALKERLLALHPYDTPCILALDVEQGHTPYLQWLGMSTTTSS